MEVLQQHVHAPVPVLPVDLSRYGSLIARLLAKSRNERFINAAEIIAAVTALGAPAADELEHTVAPAEPGQATEAGPPAEAGSAPEPGEAQSTAA
jgi:hypothetical protein